jgi:acyl carrier protein
MAASVFNQKNEHTMTYDPSEILKSVQEVIHQSSGVALEAIQPDATLFDDLAIDSIDMVDILFNLERKYGIELKISEIEQFSKAELGDEPFEIDQIITEKGLEVLKRNLPDLNATTLVHGITINDIIRLITVKTLAHLVQVQIDKKQS